MWQNQKVSDKTIYVQTDLFIVGKKLTQAVERFARLLDITNFQPEWKSY